MSRRAVPKADYHPPPSITRRELLVDGSDLEFRRLIYRLVLVEERLRHARTFLGRQAGLTGPQYMMLMSVAYLQGKTGIAVSVLAKELRVTSAFITGESRHLIESGLLGKKPNPLDSRSVLLSVTLAGRRRIEVLVPEVRTVNDLFFGRVSAESFRDAVRFLDELIDGSGLAISFISHREGRHLGRR